MAKYDGWFLYFGTRWGVLKWDYNANGYERTWVEDGSHLGYWVDKTIEETVESGDAKLKSPKRVLLKKYFQ